MDRPFLALVATSGLALVAALGIAGVLLGPPEPPAVLGAALPVRSVPATSITFDDRRIVSIALLRTPESGVSLSAAGLLTWSGCSAGTPMRSGDLVAKVDERPVLALSTSIPLYRDLGPGSRGTDVAALQSELARLGFGTPHDGRFAPATARAIDEAFRRHRVVNPTPGRLTRTSAVWLAQSAATVSACRLRTGGTAGPGQPFAIFAGQLQRVSLTTVPSGLTPGDRTLTAFGVTGPMTDARGSDDPAFLDGISTSAEGALLAQAASEAKDQPALTGVIQLGRPVDAVRVPVAAVFGMKGSSACLDFGGAAVPITVVGSSIGATIVRLPDGVPPPAEVGVASHDVPGPSCSR